MGPAFANPTDKGPGYKKIERGFRNRFIRCDEYPKIISVDAFNFIQVMQQVDRKFSNRSVTT